MHLQPATRPTGSPRTQGSPQEQIEAFKHRWGLDDPLRLQYFKWLGRLGRQGPPQRPSRRHAQHRRPGDRTARRRQRHHPRRLRLLHHRRPDRRRRHRRPHPADAHPRRHGLRHLGHDRVPRRHLCGRSTVRPIRLGADRLQLRGLLVPDLLARPHAHHFPSRGAAQIVPCRRHVGHADCPDIRDRTSTGRSWRRNRSTRSDGPRAPSCPAGAHAGRWSASPATRGSSGRACSTR